MSCEASEAIVGPFCEELWEALGRLDSGPRAQAGAESGYSAAANRGSGGSLKRAVA
jgi:hypothetical protein